MKRTSRRSPRATGGACTTTVRLVTTELCTMPTKATVAAYKKKITRARAAVAKATRAVAALKRAPKKRAKRRTAKRKTTAKRRTRRTRR